MERRKLEEVSNNLEIAKKQKVEVDVAEKMSLEEALSLFQLAPPFGMDEVKKRMKELMKKYHPDKNDGKTEMVSISMVPPERIQNIIILDPVFR
jgi:DnaJ-domain-containing protein 1